MPIFEFVCEKCGKQFEEIIAATAADPFCPHCGGTARRLIGLPGPLKKGAFPFKPGPVHPLAKRMAKASGSGCASGCGGGACSLQEK